MLSENLDWLVAKTRTFSGHNVAVGVASTAAVLQVPAKTIDWTDLKLVCMKYESFKHQNM